jgi:hypothetical protein
LDRKFSSLLDELIGPAAPERDKDLFIESRAQQVIASANNLIALIRETYDAETAEELRRRLINSIKSGDENKFRRRMAKIREDRLSR